MSNVPAPTYGRNTHSLPNLCTYICHDLRPAQRDNTSGLASFDALGLLGHLGSISEVTQLRNSAIGAVWQRDNAAMDVPREASLAMENASDVRLVIKSSNQQIEDQVVTCDVDWTVERLKHHLFEVYPNKPVRYSLFLPPLHKLANLTFQ